MARKKISELAKEVKKVTEKKETEIVKAPANKVKVNFHEDTQTNWGFFKKGENYVVENCARTMEYLGKCERV